MAATLTHELARYFWTFNIASFVRVPWPQEYLVVKIFEREYGLFMTFLQFFGYAACAALRRGIHRETGRKIPMRTYCGLGFLQVCEVIILKRANPICNSGQFTDVCENAPDAPLIGFV